MGILEIKEIHTIVSVNKKGVTDEVFEKASTNIRWILYELIVHASPVQWYVIYNNGTNFKLSIAVLCN